MGIILAIHWSAFFLSIQLSTVTIGLLTFSTFPIFLTFLEPWFLKEKIMLSNVVIAIITFSGVMLVVPKLQLGNNMTQGALWGIISGISYAILSMLNKKYVKDYSSLVISFYEQLVATIVLMPFLFFHRPILGTKDILLLFLLGVVFTGISHSLFINGLKHVKTQVAGIISSLEPVYGIILAAILLKEIPSLREVLGGVIILAAALYSTIKPK